MSAQPRKKCLLFEDWINEYGPDRLARVLNIHVRTVYHWREKHCDPRVEYMRIIKRLTKGKIGYEQMIDRDTPTNRGAVL